MKKIILVLSAVILTACTEANEHYRFVIIEGHKINVRKAPTENNTWSAYHASLSDRLVGDVNMIRRNNIAIENVSKCKIIPTANATGAATTTAVVSC